MSSKVGGFIFAALFVLYLLFTGDILLDFWAEEESFHARTFPYLIGFTGLLVSLILIAAPGVAPPIEKIPTHQLIPAVALVALILLYGLVLEYIGFLLSSFLMLVAGFALLGERSPARILGTAAILVGGFWWLMSLLDIYLSRGMLFETIVAYLP
jgi:putative tricarboxylic transport membrane protein